MILLGWLCRVRKRDSFNLHAYCTGLFCKCPCHDDAHENAVRTALGAFEGSRVLSDRKGR